MAQARPAIPDEDQAPTDPGDWVAVAALDELAARGRRVVKVGRKQIALFHHADWGADGGVLACNNRCPHEGYPLVEGSVTPGGGAADGPTCVLTCNWHNWKFDLADGANLTGGDRLRTYPVRVAEGRVWIDVTDPPEAERAETALVNLRDAVERYDYDRMARELSRFALAGADDLEALRRAIDWTHDRLEFGTTHAHAAAPDWLTLRERLAEDEAERLVPVLEAVANLSWDTLREKPFPYPAGRADYEPAALVAAIDAEDEPAALAQLRGALAQGLGIEALEAPLAEAALAHYQDFGHSAIYLVKTRELIERLGPDSVEPLLLALVRALIYGWREDLVPEFRGYAGHLAAWDGEGRAPVTAADFVGLDAERAMIRARDSSADPAALYDALLGAAAWNWLHFDLAHQDRTDGPISDNKSWLSFTHGVTFANAVRRLCVNSPALWPAALLQMACFAGRNAGFTDAEIDERDWAVPDPLPYLDGALRHLFDHGQTEHILLAHLVKTVTAVREEVVAAPAAPWVATMLAATRRFLESPVKRRQSLRSARQALKFVSLEG